jgi:hypothetical protein
MLIHTRRKARTDYTGEPNVGFTGLEKVTFETEEEIAYLYKFLKEKLFPCFEDVDPAIFIGAVTEFVQNENNLIALDVAAIEEGHENHCAKCANEADEKVQAITLTLGGKTVSAGYESVADKFEKDAFAHTQGFENDLQLQAKLHEIKLAEEKARL